MDTLEPTAKLFARLRRIHQPTVSKLDGAHLWVCIEQIKQKRSSSMQKQQQAFVNIDFLEQIANDKTIVIHATYRRNPVLFLKPINHSYPERNPLDTGNAETAPTPQCAPLSICSTSHNFCQHDAYASRSFPLRNSQFILPNSPSPCPPPSIPQDRHLRDVTQQLRLQNIFPLLIFLTRFKGLVVLPPYRLSALPTGYIPHDMPPCGHVALAGVAGGDVDDVVEEVGFAMLAAEIL
jgi:hypothetical protein